MNRSCIVVGQLMKFVILYTLLLFSLLFENTMSAFDANVALKEALTFHKLGNFESALEGYKKVLPLVTNSVACTIHNNMGGILMNQGDSELSLQSFSAALSVCPDSAQSHFNVAVLLTTKLNKHGKALRHCKSAIKIDPSMHKAYHLMGNILQSTGNPEDAELYFSKADEIAQSNTATVTGSESSKAYDNARIWRSMKLFLEENQADSYVHSVPNHGDITIRCLSQEPLIYRISNILTHDEISHIRNRAEPLLESSIVMGRKKVSAECGESSCASVAGEPDEPYRSSHNAWLHADDVLISFKHRLAEIMGLPVSYLLHNTEELQVVKYVAGGQFQAHQDSSTFHRRVATALVYLSGDASSGTATTSEGNGGETWFPFANKSRKSDSLVLNGQVGVDMTIERGLDIAEQMRAHNKVQAPDTEDRSMYGIAVPPSEGDMVLFFNHIPSPHSSTGDLSFGELDPLAIHAGLPVLTGQKWVANYWIS